MYKLQMQRGQLGWRCWAEFEASTAQQFTDVQVEGRLYVARWAWLAFLKCLILTELARRRINRRDRAARKLKGWT